MEGNESPDIVVSNSQPEPDFSASQTQKITQKTLNGPNDGLESEHFILSPDEKFDVGFEDARNRVPAAVIFFLAKLKKG